jgi:hypothetical protein
MDEFTLIKKLESLKSIKPDSKWASFNKQSILSQEFDKKTFSLLDYLRQPKLVPAFASFLMLFAITPFFFAQDALPGESLYKFKKIGELIKYNFITSNEEKSIVQLEQVQSRLSELDKITEQSENQGKKLAAGIKETKQAISKATQELASVPEYKKAELVEKIVTQITAIEKKTNAAIMDSDEKEYQELYNFFVENEIKELELRQESLSEDQKEILLKVKELFEQGKYSEALEMIYQIQPNN